MNKFNNFSKENHLGPSLEGSKNTLKSAQGVLQNNASTARQNKKKTKAGPARRRGSNVWESLVKADR